MAARPPLLDDLSKKISMLLDFVTPKTPCKSLTGQHWAEMTRQGMRTVLNDRMRNLFLLLFFSEARP